MTFFKNIHAIKQSVKNIPNKWRKFTYALIFITFISHCFLIVNKLPGNKIICSTNVIICWHQSSINQINRWIDQSMMLISGLLGFPFQLVQSMPWSTQPKIDEEWKRKAACDMLNSLSEARWENKIGHVKTDRS